MAKMYPVQIDPGTRSPGEKEIFQRLRDDPITDGWFVLHSLDIAIHRSQVAGELDFVVIIPSKGGVCLEVKAHNSIACNGGTWYFGSNPKPDPRGPFKQASQGMHSIRKFLLEKRPELSRVVFWSAVVLPYVEFDEVSPEWHPWQVIDNHKFITKSIGQNILDVINHARKFLTTSPNATWFDHNSAEPDSKQCKLIANDLRPEFEFFESPLSRQARRNEELKRYTEEQYEALDGMMANPRVIFSGPAGTGKTLLALEAARRSCALGQKTLLVCFNHLLGSEMKEQTKPLQPSGQSI